MCYANIVHGNQHRPISVTGAAAGAGSPTRCLMLRAPRSATGALQWPAACAHAYMHAAFIFTLTSVFSVCQNCGWIVQALLSPSNAPKPIRTKLIV